MLLSMVAALTLQSQALPAPSGHFSIGTRVVHLVDARRQDPVDASRKREVMVQYWYPTDEKAGRAAPYVPGQNLLRELVARTYYFQTKEDLEKWGSMHAHAFSDAPVRASRKWPVLLLTPGLGLSRISYTTYCEDLASHGFFVAAIDPCRGGLSVLPDGRVLSADDDPAYEDEAKQEAKTAEWAGDISFVLDEILARAGDFSIDPKKVGALGHSMGGAASIQAAQSDPRIGAAVDMDGSGGVPNLDAGLRKPILFLGSNPNYSDEDLAKLGRTRAQWEERVKQSPSMFPKLLPGRTSAPVYKMSIRDTGHLSFSDAPFLMPNTLTRFSSHPLDPNRTLNISMEITRAFFGHYLLGEKWVVIDTLTPPWKEVEITRVH